MQGLALGARYTDDKLIVRRVKVHCTMARDLPQVNNAKTPESSTRADAPPSALEGGKFNPRAPLPLPADVDVD
jgi:hypothetical protein